MACCSSSLPSNSTRVLNRSLHDTVQIVVAVFDLLQTRCEKKMRYYGGLSMDEQRPKEGNIHHGRVKAS
jgi:hypothetical protein